MSWSLPGWSRQPGTFQLVLGYGENPSPNPNPAGQATPQPSGLEDSSKSGSDGEKTDAAAECKIRVLLEWGAGEDEAGVVLKLQSQLMMALPYPEKEVQVRMVPQSEAAQTTPETTAPPQNHGPSDPPGPNGTDSKSPGSARTGDLSPSSSWGFLGPTIDRLAASIGRNPNAESVPSTPAGSADVRGSSVASSEGAYIEPVNKGPDEKPDGSVKAFGPRTAFHEGLKLHDDAHSDNETFEDAPHSFPPIVDTTSPGPTPSVPAAPGAVSSDGKVPVRTVVRKRTERLRVILVSRPAGSGPSGEGVGVLNKIVEESEIPGVEHLALTEGVLGFWEKRGADMWAGLRTLNLSGCNLSVVPPGIAQLPSLEVLLLDNNKLVAPPSDLGKLTSLRKLSMDHNLLLSVPIELRDCTSLAELSLEHNRLVRPLLDFRSMARTLQTLRLFGNPLEFLPEILPCRKLRQVSLANVRIKGDAELTSVEVHVEDDAGATSYYFGGAKHRLSTFFQLIFRYSSCQHPLLASALARIAEDGENRAYIGRDEGAIRQLLSMVLSDDTHVVQQACKALSCIAMDATLVARLVKADVLQSIWAVLGSTEPEIQVSVLQVLASVAFCSDSIAARLFTPDMLHRLKELCGSENALKVREEALLVLGNLAFSPSNRRAMASAQGLRSLLAKIALTEPAEDAPNPSRNHPKPFQKPVLGRPKSSPDLTNIKSAKLSHSSSEPSHKPGKPGEQPPPPEGSPFSSPPAFRDFTGAPKTSAHGSAARVRASAVRALAIMGENELVRKATGRRPLGSRGVKILSLDGGGMRGMATVRMLRRLEKGTGRRIHELFDLICGTSTGAMLAVALGVKEMSLDECEGIYKRLGKIVFAADDKDTEKDAASFATWREKLDLMYKSGAQNLRVVIHGAKHDATQFEGLLQEMSAFQDGRNLLIETAGRGGPKVSVVSTLVSVTPAQPFVFRNYQYPPGTRESAPWAAPVTPLSPQINPGGAAFGGGGGGGLAATPAPTPVQSRVGMGHVAYMGSCKHLVWQAIRASSAAPYYLDDFSDGNNRWQDGAVTANNPAIIAVREARLLWPDVQIDTVVSLGCASLPTKPRGKNWKHVDTGSVLIESACSVERVEEAMDTLAPLVPNLEYVRFNPVDESGAMELDETDPAQWARLEAATQDYVDLHDAHFAALCARLTSDLLAPSERATGASESTKLASERADSASGIGTSASGSRNPAFERAASASGASEDVTSVSGTLTLDDDTDEAPLLRLHERSMRKATGGKVGEENGGSARENGDAVTEESQGEGRGQESESEEENGDVDFADLSGLRRKNVHTGSRNVGRLEESADAIGGRELDRGFSFSQSFSFGGLEAGDEVPVEPRAGSVTQDAIDLNPSATWRADGGATWQAERDAPAEKGPVNEAAEPGPFKSNTIRSNFEDGGNSTSERPAANTRSRDAAAQPRGLEIPEQSAAAVALGLRRGLLFVEAPPGTAAAEGFGVWADGASLLHHSASHRPLIDVVCEQNKITRDVFDGRIHTGVKPAKPAVLTRPLSSPSLPTPVKPISRSNSLTKLSTARPPSPGAGLARVNVNRESRDGEAPSEPEEALGFPAQALYERLQTARSVGVVHLALSGDQRGLVLGWQSDVVAVAEPGDEARAFLERLSGGTRYGSVAELCARHRQFDVGAAVFTLIGRHTQFLPGGEEVGAFIFRRTVPSAFMTADDVRNMVGVWRDRIVVSSRFSLTQPVIEALLDGGAKAVFELSLSDVSPADFGSDDVASVETTTDASNSWGSALTPVVRSVFTPTVDSAPTPAPQEKQRNGTGSRYSTYFDLPEDSVLEELIASFYSALYREGLSVDQVDAAVQRFGSRGGCRLYCHLPSH